MVFLNVGQGDSALIKHGDIELVIDGGPIMLLSDKISKYLSYNDKTIEVAELSHTDNDHYEGFLELSKVYKIETFIMPAQVEESADLLQLLSQLESQKTKIITAKEGLGVEISPGVLLDILRAPSKGSQDTGNDASIVSRLSYYSTSFLFTGDATQISEAKMITEKSPLKSDILKVGHHGSKYSSSEKFLETVSPAEAIISVGEDNIYGHPAKEVLNRLTSLGINIFRTDTNGDIKYSCSFSLQKCTLDN